MEIDGRVIQPPNHPHSLSPYNLVYGMVQAMLAFVLASCYMYVLYNRYFKLNGSMTLSCNETYIIWDFTHFFYVVMDYFS